jgi:PAS domain-containing protein
VSFIDSLPQESSAHRAGQPQYRRPTVTTANQNKGERALRTLMMPIGMLIEFIPCAVALWSADRNECAFNSAAKTLLGYSENNFCADQNLWLDRIDRRDREIFSSSWKALQDGERKISCRYRFTPQDHARSVRLQETAVLLPVGPSGRAAVFSVYQTNGRQPRRGRHDNTRVRGLIHHMGNSLQAILGELDLLHLTGALPQRSFENITQDVEQLHDLMSELAGLSDPEAFVFASAQRARRKSS